MHLHTNIRYLEEDGERWACSHVDKRVMHHPAIVRASLLPMMNVARYYCAIKGKKRREGPTRYLCDKFTHLTLLGARV